MHAHTHARTHAHTHTHAHSYCQYVSDEDQPPYDTRVEYRDYWCIYPIGQVRGWAGFRV